MIWPDDFIDKIICGDCLEVMKGIPDKAVDLVLTDPPYKFESMGGGFYAKNASAKREYLDSLRKINCVNFNPSFMLEILKKKLKLFYGYFFTNKFLIEPYLSFARKNGYKYDILVMAKSNPIPAHNNHYLSDLEYVIMIREAKTYFSNHKNLDDFRKFYLTNCKKREHPAQKDIGIIQKFIRVSSREGDLILDPFLGSGTTAVACIELNRRFIGIELSPEYCEMAKKRISKIQPQLW